MNRLPLVLVATLVLPFALAAGEEAPPPTKLADFAWLAGTWRQDTGPDSVWEEHWMAPRGDSVVALTRWVEKGRARLYEITAIERDGEAVVLRLRHFGHGIVDQGEPMAWKLARLDGQEAVFRHDEREFPKRIVYHRKGDELEVRLEGKVRGEERAQRFRFRRAQD